MPSFVIKATLQLQQRRRQPQRQRLMDKVFVEATAVAAAVAVAVAASARRRCQSSWSPKIITQPTQNAAIEHNRLPNTRSAKTTEFILL